MMRTHHETAAKPVQPWLLTTPAGFATAVDRLKQRNKQWLFVVLARAAASGDWRMFNAAMERAARVKDVPEFLEGRSEFLVALLYERTELPRELYPLFVAVVMLSWSICQDIKGVRPGKHLRMLILDKVFQRPEISGLPAAADLRRDLYA